MILTAYHFILAFGLTTIKLTKSSALLWTVSAAAFIGLARLMRSSPV